MATKTLKLNLKNADIPFIPGLVQRPIIIPNLDQAGKLPRSFYGAEDNYDYNVPAVIYAENLMPTAAGFRAAIPDMYGNTPSTALPGCFGAGKSFRGVYYTNLASISICGSVIWSRREADVLGVATEPIAALGVPGTTYPAPPSGSWHWITTHQSTLPQYWAKYITAVGIDNTLTVMCISHQFRTGSVGLNLRYVHPSTGVVHTKIGTLWTFQQVAGGAAELVPQAGDTTTVAFPHNSGQILGLTEEGLRPAQCVSYAYGYLLLGCGTSFAWGVETQVSGLTAFNFKVTDTSGNITGAGYQTPQQINSSIVHIVAVDGGVLLFTESNCVAALYSSADVSAPWIYKEVAGAGGLLSNAHVTTMTAGKGVYAYTTNGLQFITVNSARPVFPSCQTWLSSGKIPSLEVGTGKFDSTDVVLEVRLTSIAGKYLVVSYGGYTPSTQDIYQGAYIYDEGLQRWGHIKISHSDVAEFPFAYLPTRPFGDIIFITNQTGTIGKAQPGSFCSLVSDPVSIAASGSGADATLVLGDIGLTRDRFTELQYVSVDNEYAMPAPLAAATLTVHYSFDGRNFSSSVALMANPRVGTEHTQFMEFGGLVEAKAHRLHFTGKAISPVGIVAEVAPGGKL